MSGPSGDKIIYVDMTNQTAEVKDFPEEWKLLGGRALSAKILTADCDPKCDPLGPDNVLVMAPGVLSGTAAPTSGRISIGAKSPLTGGIKEANTGGQPGQHLMKLGYRAIVVKGAPSDAEARYAVEINEDGVSVTSADAHKGKWNYTLCQDLHGQYPKTASFITCGPAGEARLSGASVATTDQDNRFPARHAARGGLGAVMGSKGLKYVMVDPGRASVRQPSDRKKFGELCKTYTKDYLDGPQMFKTGTSSVVPVANMLHTFPYKNRVEGQSPDAQTLDGARIVESFETRGGEMHNCMTGCIVKCSNVVHDAQGEYKTSALEFETLTLLGANCAVASWEDVADMDRLCDEVGLDTIETGAAIAVLMDAGQLEWGDAEAMKKLIAEIPELTDRGKAIGNGAVATGKFTGHHRVPHAKGQAIPAWDPRPLKATGVTYCTSPMGADHTAGLIVNPGLQPDQFAWESQKVQIVNAVCDSSGFCQFLQPNLDNIRDFYGALYGEEFSREAIHDQGWECLADEWAFNDAAGFGASDDVMAECLSKDPINGQVFDVPADIVAAARQRMPAQDDLFEAKASG
ncbi:MAG: aldehyde ferredoxin oxidoreductase N-terminal domain-containing protein [Myxococcota bacterium]|nr:aldehyde ferredoxin oxidoreductase N-terminal domain-containing protein [Myxococcota bacterium]